MSAMRNFDPRAVGALECRAWETYYRRKWAACLVAFVGLVRAAFRMNWPRTLYGSWLVLRANMKWAPFPDNDPEACRALMRRFYRLLRASEGASFDPARAAEVEVEWWRAHREHQHDGESPGGDSLSGSAGAELAASRREPLVLALVDLYAYTYGAERDELRRAAELRAEAMDLSDRWVEAGRDPGDPLLAQERALLIRSYAALLAAVHR
jgi:hypothetical protein